MKFSLRTLLLTVMMLPPVIGFFVLNVYRRNPESPFQFPDPILLLGVVGWLVAYAVLVREPSDAPNDRSLFNRLSRFRISFVEVLQLLVLVGMSAAALAEPLVEVVFATRLVAFCLAAACLIVVCRPRSEHRRSAIAALAGGLLFFWIVAEQTVAFLAPYFYPSRTLASYRFSGQWSSFVDISSVIASVFCGIFLGYLVRSLNAPKPDEPNRSEDNQSEA